jgi:hypothetical protein
MWFLIAVVVILWAAVGFLLVPRGRSAFLRYVRSPFGFIMVGPSKAITPEQHYLIFTTFSVMASCGATAVLVLAATDTI